MKSAFKKDRVVKFAIDLTWIYKYNISSRTRRDVRVVEGATLEKSCSSRNHGFESHSLRKQKAVKSYRIRLYGFFILVRWAFSGQKLKFYQGLRHQ